jgi:hypothetical protein
MEAPQATKQAFRSNSCNHRHSSSKYLHGARNQ